MNQFLFFFLLPHSHVQCVLFARLLFIHTFFKYIFFSNYVQWCFLVKTMLNFKCWLGSKLIIILLPQKHLIMQIVTRSNIPKWFVTNGTFIETTLPSKPIDDLFHCAMTIDDWLNMFSWTLAKWQSNYKTNKNCCYVIWINLIKLASYFYYWKPYFCLRTFENEIYFDYVNLYKHEHKSMRKKIRKLL
jgi:hypothetical protein